METANRIEICGGIASGKTTLCNVLGKYGVQSEFENFKENPFWALFYTNPSLHAFETEVTFLLQHYSQIKMSATNDAVVAVDYSLLQDLAYANVNLSKCARRIFQVVYRHLQRKLAPPKLIVHLRCSTAEELRRIKLRARQEEETVRVLYLDALNGAINRAVARARRHTVVLQIDSDAVDFAHDRGAQEHVVREIFAAAGG